MSTDRAQAARDALAKAKADREALAAKRAADNEIAALERAAADEAAIFAAESEHGEIGKDIAVIETDAGVIIVKRPNPVIFKRFVDQAKSKADDLDKLARSCLVYPDVAAYERITTTYAGVPLMVADAAAGLARGRSEELKGKS